MTFLAPYRDRIADETLVVVFIDECHLKWRDICGYGWGLSHHRLTTSIVNVCERQTYYGALNMQTGAMMSAAYATANTHNTIAFLEQLRAHYEGKPLILLWDNARYHRSAEMQTYLAHINQNTTKDNRLIHCINFAPYAPEQNPIETVWLKAKQIIRTHFQENPLFKRVKELFVNSIHDTYFDFPKLHMYT